MDKKFLFHYPMGARGDFLSAILLNQFILLEPDNYSIPPIPNKVVKVHGIKNIVPLYPFFPRQLSSFDEMFDEAKKHKLITIKIVAETLEEKLDVAYFGWIKSIVPTLLDPGKKIGFLHLKLQDAKPENYEKLVIDNIYWFLNAIQHDIPQIQDEDKEYTAKYDYVIRFNDLFNIDFIKEFYKKIHNEPIPFFVISKISQNILIQNRPSESESFGVFKEIYQHFVSIEHLREKVRF